MSKIATISIVFMVFLTPAGNVANAEGPEDILVIANKTVSETHMDSDDIVSIFLKKRKSWRSGSKVVPINAKKGTAIREQFLNRLLEMTAEEEATYWEKQKITKGVEPPPEFANNLKAVFHLKGSVSYVYRSEYREGVAKILYVLPKQ